MLEAGRDAAKEIHKTPGVRIVAPVFVSRVMQDVMAAAEDVAAAGTTVLLTGESGTGKEVLARLIHRHSPRNEGPWVAVNCAALPSELLESELFGHERGAFTGASERRIGKIEQASGGTLLLDEISEMPLPLQAKLLRVLQEREVDRVGGTKPVPVDVRFIATSNRDLEAAVAAGRFRADLYYRLCVFPIALPPLRKRPEDIVPLSEHFLDHLARELCRPRPALSPAARAALTAYAFPGNVRELRNVLERALVRCREATLEPRHFAALGEEATAQRPPEAPRQGSDAGAIRRVTPLPPELELGDADRPWDLPVDLGALERLAIREALRRVDGNRTHAARLLGISLRTLRNKLRLYRQESAGVMGPDDDADLDDDASDSTLAHKSQRDEGRDRERAA